MSRHRFNEEQLHAWLDNELPPDQRAEVEAYLAGEPEEAARLAAYRRHDASLRARFDPVLDEPVPAQFSRRGARPRPAVGRSPRLVRGGRHRRLVRA